MWDRRAVPRWKLNELEDPALERDLRIFRLPSNFLVKNPASVPKDSNQATRACAPLVAWTRYFFVVMSRVRSILRSTWVSSGAAKVDAMPWLEARPVRPTR